MKIIHAMGYDLFRISDVKAKGDFLGLDKMNIKTILDVGANRGQFAARALAAFPGAKIFCFEPLKAPFEDLEKWAKAQNGRVKAFNLALGDREGEEKMFLHKEHDDSSSMLGTTEECEKLYSFTKKQEVISVPLSTLDKVAREKISLVPEILIKIDVQGYEDKVLGGSQETLKKSRACILEICSDKLYEGQTTFKNIFNIMDSSGFTYAGNLEQVKAPDGHVAHFDAVFLRKL